MQILKSFTSLRWNISPKARLLFGIVAAGGVGTLIAIILLLNSSLSIVANKMDEMDMLRGNDLVQSAVETNLNRLTSITTDNARHGGAVEHLYGPALDIAWLERIWGGPSDRRPYDGAYLLDENQRVLWGHFHNAPYTQNDPSVFGSGFRGLIAKNRQVIDSGERAVSGLSRTRHGAAVISIALVRPHDMPITGMGPGKRYLVMTRHLTHDRLERTSGTYRLDNLRLIAADDNTRPFHNLVGADGITVARLTWTPRLSGAVAAQAARPQIQQITWLAGGLVLMFVLVSAYSLQRLARSEKDARSFALTDGLSGLPNRRALYEHLRDVGKQRGKLDQTIVFIDLDGFKDVNDLYGHNVGDKLIMIVAAALKEHLPAGAFLSRMGGDEFAMLTGGQDGPLHAQAFAEAALAFLSAPIRVGERTLQIGASIGIASGNLKLCRSHELLRRADMAMYHSKATGKGRITPYDAELDAVRLRKQALEQSIRDGLARDEFDVVYQPVVDARTLAVTTVEALVRWPRRPEGPLPPDQFIDAAEASGLIHPLGQFVLKKACSDLCAWPQLRLSVNISPAQFRDPDFERKVGEVLSETGFPVERLELEVTEGYLIENPERATAAVKNLKALGVSMALDDFGTGYASVGYLRRFDFDRIKIDKSLAGKVDRDPQAAALVAGTVSIAQALHIAITAEGVETAEQVKLLKLAGCHSLQGFYFSRPKPLSEVLDMLDAQAPVAIAG